MTPHEWDRHRMAYCWRCDRYPKHCSTYNTLTRDSNDPAGSAIKDGVCVYYRDRSKKKK